MYEKSDTNCCLTNQIRQFEGGAFPNSSIRIESFQSSYFCFLVFNLIHILCIFVTNALLFLLAAFLTSPLKWERRTPREQSDKPSMCGRPSLRSPSRSEMITCYIRLSFTLSGQHITITFIINLPIIVAFTISKSPQCCLQLFYLTNSQI